MAPYTLILTQRGYFPISFFEGAREPTSIWNGETWSDVDVCKTGEDRPMLKLSFSNGLQLTCTPEHIFYVVIGDDIQKVSADKLTGKHRLLPCTWPVLKGYTLHNIRQPFGSAILCTTADDVPINSTLECRLEFLQGYIERYGQLSVSQNAIVLINSDHADVQRAIVLLLQTLGVGLTDNMVVPIINSAALKKLTALGLKLNQNQFDLSALTEPVDGEKIRSYVQMVYKENAPNSDTYCFTERKVGRGIFGGICAGQCAEITLYTSKNEIAVCNLASINLLAFVRDGLDYDFEGLSDAASELTFNLNMVIDRTYYPTPETRNSNHRHRPIGVGQQGLADVFFMMRLPFDSEQALNLSTDIAEAIYYGAVRESCRLARIDGPYSTFKGSPASKGLLQYRLWDENYKHRSGRFDWVSLEQNVIQHGLRNSMLTAIMPTASTSSILGRTEACEALSSNLYVRRTSAGEFTILNSFLVEDLVKLNLWNPTLMNQLIADNGSVQQLDIPADLKHLYLTTWELKQRFVIDQAAARGVYVCQSQSLNIFLEEPSLAKVICQISKPSRAPECLLFCTYFVVLCDFCEQVTSALFHGWNLGLKTLSYYLRTRPRASAIKFTVDAAAADASRKAAQEKQQTKQFCTRDMMEAGCESCSG